MEKKTPLYQTHLDEGGKMVPFAGYLLPVQYPTGVIAEHMAVRTACGLFDVSHMGEIVFRGEGALATLNHLLTNDFTNMTIGRVRYCRDSAVQQFPFGNIARGTGLFLIIFIKNPRAQACHHCRCDIQDDERYRFPFHFPNFTINP